MSERLPENVVNLEELLPKLALSLREAAKKLSESFKSDWEEPYIYTIPKMSASVKMSLSYSSGKVKSVLFWKGTSSEELLLVSSVDFELVAVPGARMAKK